MKTAIYVFIGVLAAIIVAYLLSELLAYIRRVNRAIKNNEVKLRPYASYDNMVYRPWYRDYNNPPRASYDMHFDKIEVKLRSLEDKVDLLVEDFEEIMSNKERPSDE